MWGQHLIVDVEAGTKEKVRDPEAIRAFFEELIPAIRMRAFGDLQLVHFGHGKLAGWTAIQLIETSTISCHFLDESGDFYLDVFSCKRFKAKTVLDLIKKHFETQTWTVTALERDAKR